MSPYERGDWLQYVWCRTKLGIPPRRAVRLFRGVPQLRELVPKDWPDTIRLYRGARSWAWARARRVVRRGVSWTTDRSVAMTFAIPLASLPDTTGCLGATMIARQDVLAYFMNDDNYTEKECIIDPAGLGRIVYEHVTGEVTPV